MQQNIRPILYSGYTISTDKVVKKRLYRTDRHEVYRLTDGRILRLEISSTNKQRNNGSSIHLGHKTYQYLIISTSANSGGQNNKPATVSGGLDCVAGMDDLKKVIREDIIDPLKHPERYHSFKVAIPNGLLLVGPPGCGKTFIVRNLAAELEYTFIELKHSDLVSKWAHETTSNIGKVFNEAYVKRPAIVFIDEIEGIAPARGMYSYNYKNEEVNELLMQINRAGSNNVLVVGATNRPELIDQALLRPGRMDKVIYVGPPDRKARIELFYTYLHDRPTSNISYDHLADLTSGYSCADISYIADESARQAVGSNLPAISEDLVASIIAQTKSSIDKSSLAKYNKFIQLQR